MRGLCRLLRVLRCLVHPCGHSQLGDLFLARALPKYDELIALAQRLEVHHQGHGDIDGVDEPFAQLFIPCEGMDRADGDLR